MILHNTKKIVYSVICKTSMTFIFHWSPCLCLLSKSEVSAYLYWFVASEEVKTLMKSLSIAMQHTINAIARDKLPIIIKPNHQTEACSLYDNLLFWCYVESWIISQDPYQFFFINLIMYCDFIKFNLVVWSLAWFTIPSGMILHNTNLYSDITGAP